jgi:hypothetical protein
MSNTNFSTTSSTQTITLASGVETVVASFTDLSLAKSIYLAVKVTAGDDLTAFKMQVRYGPDFDWQDYLNSNDWTGTNKPAQHLWASGNPASLSAGEGAEVQAQTLGFVEAQFLATNAGSGTSTTQIAARAIQK